MNTAFEGVVAKLTHRNGGFGVWVTDVVAQLQAEGYAVTFAEFATWALEAHRAHTVTLRRQDLVSTQWAFKVSASEIKGLAGSTFHTIEA
jgi:hypothetical protein